MTTPAVNAARASASRLRWVAGTAGVLILAGLVGWPWLQEWSVTRDAERLAAENRFDANEPLLQRLHERHPRNVAVVRALALGYYDARQLAATEHFLDRWCELQPREKEPYWRRLRFRMMQQKIAPAIADARYVLELAPKDRETRVALVHLLMTEGRYEEAEQEGLRCFQENPKDVDMWLALANLYHALGQRPGGDVAKAKAADLTDQILRVAPEHLSALKLRAKLYLEAGQTEPAIRLLKTRVVRVDDPESIEGLYELSEALFRAGRVDEAKKMQAELQGRQAFALWSKYAQRDDNLGLQQRVVEWMLATGKTDDAVKFLSGILERNPQAPAGTHRLLAVCYDKQGRPERAVEQRRLAEGKQETR